MEYEDHKDQMTEDEYRDLAFKKAGDNHIWLNAASCICPTDEFKMEVGNMILDKLLYKHTQIPSSGITDENKIIRELAIATPVLYIMINKS